MAGDFNADTLAVLTKSNFNYNMVLEDVDANDNGDRLKSFYRLKKVSMIQSYLHHELANRYTWFSNDHVTKKVFDYILDERYPEQYIEDCRVASEFYFESDHRLLIASFKTPSTKKARWRERQPKKRYLNEKALKQLIIRTAFVEAVNRQFQVCDTDSVNIENVSENITTNF